MSLFQVKLAVAAVLTVMTSLCAAIIVMSCTRAFGPSVHYVEVPSPAAHWAD